MALSMACLASVRSAGELTPAGELGSTLCDRPERPRVKRPGLNDMVVVVAIAKETRLSRGVEGRGLCLPKEYGDKAGGGVLWSLCARALV
jgi:hypothetical protein